MSMTRAQAKQLEETSSALEALPFFDADIETWPFKVRKSCKQKRREKLGHTAISKAPPSVPEPPLGFKIPVNLVELQREDMTLTPLFQRAVQGEPETETNHCRDETFYLKGNVLHRKQGPQTQLVVPKVVRDLVLTLGHSIPWAGHLGKNKTISRIKKHFFLAGFTL